MIRPQCDCDVDIFWLGGRGTGNAHPCPEEPNAGVATLRECDPAILPSFLGVRKDFVVRTPRGI